MIRAVELTPGILLGPYRVGEPLGAGGMGEVYRARDTRLARDVAIKILPAEFAGDADRLARFEREARATAALSHPNILAVYDVGSFGGRPYLVTELVEGETLRTSTLASRFAAARAVDYAAQVARGLTAAHERGIIHRDLKPENLMVTADGKIKILDFGLAKVLDRSPDAETLTVHEATTPGKVMGTVAYMSPEQALVQRSTTAPTSSLLGRSCMNCLPDGGLSTARLRLTSCRRSSETIPHR